MMFAKGDSLSLPNTQKKHNVIARLNRVYRDTKHRSLQNAMQLFTKQDTSTRKNKAAAQYQYCNYIQMPLCLRIARFGLHQTGDTAPHSRTEYGDTENFLPLQGIEPRER